MENPLSKSLDRVFNTKSTAMIGASASFGKWGQMIFSNIVTGGFQGKLYPVNPREKRIYGVPVYQRVQDIPKPADLAIITTPAVTVVSLLEDCGQRGIKTAVVVTSGFSVTGAEGRALENKLVTCAGKEAVLVGPNTMGILCTSSNLYATGPHTRPRQGGVAFISQSGNLRGQLTQCYRLLRTDPPPARFPRKAGKAIYCSCRFKLPGRPEDPAVKSALYGLGLFAHHGGN